MEAKKLAQEILSEDALPQGHVAGFAKIIEMLDAIIRRAEATKSAVRHFAATKGSSSDLPMVKYSFIALYKGFEGQTERLIGMLK